MRGRGRKFNHCADLKQRSQLLRTQEAVAGKRPFLRDDAQVSRKTRIRCFYEISEARGTLGAPRR